ncbi:MAG: C45 family autoproteolytic acyltransferase/hydrolase [Candidatus Bathyarchaeia archaeon]
MVLPFEQGEIRGKREKESIRHILDEVKRATSFFDVDNDNFLEINEDNLKHIPERYVEEARGMASGSGFTEEQLLGINFGKGIRNLFREGCTAFAIPSDYTPGGGTLLLKNRDLGYRRLHPQVLSYSRLDGYNEFLGVTTGGNAFWYQGINNKRLVAFNTATRCGKYMEGVGINILITRILEECDDVEEALDLIDSEQIDACSNLFLADRDQIKIVELKRGFPNHVTEVDKPQARANHYLYHDNAEATGSEDTLRMLQTKTRFERARQLLNSKEEIGVKDLIRFSRDHDHGPNSYSICRHAAFVGTNLDKLLSSSTLSSQIFCIGEKIESYVALGRPCQTEFLHYCYGEEITDPMVSGKMWLDNLEEQS